MLGIAADGVYGPNTSRAVAKWQADNKLAVDGVFGPASERAMFPSTTTLTVPVQGITYTFNPKQLLIAREIYLGAHSRGLGNEGARIGLITAAAESKFRMYASSREELKLSLTLPHDAVGSDYDSLNELQQRPSQGWGGPLTLPMNERVRNLMNHEWAIAQFYKRFTYDSLRNTWRTMAPGDVAQLIQGSAYPDRYAEWLVAADKLIAHFS